MRLLKMSSQNEKALSEAISR